MQGFPGVRALRAPTGAQKLRAGGQLPSPTKPASFNLHTAERGAHATAHPHTIFQKTFRQALKQYGHPGTATVLALQAMQRANQPDPSSVMPVQPIDTQG